MTTATKNLEKDHEYILRLIDVMETMVKTKSENISDMETAVKIIQEFADGFHHAKEEQLLFPALGTKGFAANQGPVAVMLHDHVEGRGFVKGIVDGIESFKKGNASAIQAIYFNMNNYGELLRGHIGKENNVLFRMADNVLSQLEQQNLLLEFAKVEAKNFGNGKIQEYITSIETLETIYNK
jgi:hemerythrin-like domain-containing protein